MINSGFASTSPDKSVKTILNIYAACLLLVFGLTIRAFAAAGNLTHPGLAFPEGFPESDRTNIMAALQRTNCESKP